MRSGLFASGSNRLVALEASLRERSMSGPAAAFESSSLEAEGTEDRQILPPLGQSPLSARSGMPNRFLALEQRLGLGRSALPESEPSLSLERGQSAHGQVTEQGIDQRVTDRRVTEPQMEARRASISKRRSANDRRLNDAAPANSTFNDFSYQDLSQRLMGGSPRPLSPSAEAVQMSSQMSAAEVPTVAAAPLSASFSYRALEQQLPRRRERPNRGTASVLTTFDLDISHDPAASPPDQGKLTVSPHSAASPEESQASAQSAAPSQSFSIAQRAAPQPTFSYRSLASSLQRRQAAAVPVNAPVNLPEMEATVLVDEDVLSQAEDVRAKDARKATVLTETETEAEAIVPEVIVPEAIVPEVIVPEAIVPEVIVPEAIVLEVHRLTPPAVENAMPSPQEPVVEAADTAVGLIDVAVDAIPARGGSANGSRIKRSKTKHSKTKHSKTRRSKTRGLGTKSQSPPHLAPKVLDSEPSIASNAFPTRPDIPPDFRQKNISQRDELFPSDRAPPE